MILASESHLYSCFCIRSEGGIGTAFAFGEGTRSYFLTAAHVLGGATAGGYVYFRKRSDWERYEIRAVRRHSAGQDVAAFSVTGMQINVSHRFSHEKDPDIGLGQEVKFTGFPHGLTNTLIGPDGYNTPLVRTAFFSGLVDDPILERRLLILDGLNNPGYSGSPVWAPGVDVSQPSLLAIVSGYRVEQKSKSRVFRTVEGCLEEEVPNMFVKPNSGMIHAISYQEIETVTRSMDDFNKI